MKLIDVCELIVDCPHSTAKDEGQGIPLVRTPNIGKGRLELSGVHRVSEVVYNQRIERAVPQAGDLILAREAPVGNVALIMSGQKVCLGQRVVLIRPDKEKADPAYLTYYLLSEEVQHRLKNNANGAVVAHLNMNEIRNLVIELPEISIQKRIASVLSSLDDKIALNNRINHNLEEQAQALYKSWFVDFEPFKEGEFVDSELGLIPEGWRVGTLSELGDIVAGGTPSKAKPEYYTNNGIAWLTPKDLSAKCNKFTAGGETDITEDGYRNSSAKLMPRGSVLFSSRAPIGYISIAKGDICTNQGFKSVVPTYAGTAYLYYWLCENTEAIEAQASGSTFKEASGSLMRSFPALVPEKSVIDSFEKELSPILNEQEILEEEINHAEQIRDSLLPRLMSGELVMNC